MKTPSEAVRKCGAASVTTRSPDGRVAKRTVTP
jgi:hypothetical protein